MPLLNQILICFFSVVNTCPSFKAAKGLLVLVGVVADVLIELSKSPSIDLFTNVLTGFEDVVFVSLQYGESESVVNDWKKQGIHVIHDSSVDPLKDLDTWISQVAACDAVVSVANTTIHGSGGLNIPTQCLLSQNSDWRWLKNQSIERSYWYPSVGIARQSNDDQWSFAIQKVRDWISNGTPMPTGRQFL